MHKSTINGNNVMQSRLTGRRVIPCSFPAPVHTDHQKPISLSAALPAEMIPDTLHSRILGRCRSRHRRWPSICVRRVEYSYRTNPSQGGPSLEMLYASEPLFAYLLMLLGWSFQFLLRKICGFYAIRRTQGRVLQPPKRSTYCSSYKQPHEF